jgi:glycosyltransferase involved in cell wall biosynthesis
MVRRLFFVSPTNVADHRRGGASICSLAWLQAVCQHARGRMTVISPLSREQMPELPERVDEVIAIPGRSALSKVRHLASGSSVDRLSPFLDRFLVDTDIRDSLFLMNSSRGGRFSAWLRARGLPSITFFHNIEADFYSVSERNPILRRFFVRAADRNDRLAYEHSIASVFLTGADAQVMRTRATQAIPGAMVVDRGFFAPKPIASESGGLPPSPHAEILVSCSLGLAQNLPGLMAFLDVWGRSANRRGLAGATVVLAGAAPPQGLCDRARALPRVRLVANPSDAEMESLFASCRVCISTIDAGSGIKVRVAEALRRGRPVIATPHSCIGYESIDRRVLRVAEVPAMAIELESMLSAAEPGALERLAREEFESKLSFRAGSGSIAAVLEHAYAAAGG